MGNQKIKVLAEKHCKECNKIIYPTPQWVYKIKNKFYCSYTCWIKNKDEIDGRKRRS